tara:strand:- start:59 stop:403 length:345 start_codon:yes stop_codon:yes gene_type:complete
LLDERESILAQARALGLELSEDGSSWIPVHTESTKIIRKSVQRIPVESEPSTIGPLVDAAATGLAIGSILVMGYFMAAAIAPILGFLVLWWVFLLAIGMGPIEAIAYMLDFFSG